MFLLLESLRVDYYSTFPITGIGGGIGYGSLGLTPENPGSGRFRSTAESVLTLHLMEYFVNTLQKEELLTTFQDVEMPSIITLARMELNGFGIITFFIFGAYAGRRMYFSCLASFLIYLHHFILVSGTVIMNIKFTK